MSETHAQNDPKPRIFLSRSSADAGAGATVAEILRASGHEVLIQDDFTTASFLAQMDDGLKDVAAGGRLVVLLSPAYLASDYCLAEALNALAKDPLNRLGRVIVFGVAETFPNGVLATLPVRDLSQHLGQDAEAVGRIVRGAVDPGSSPADDRAARLVFRAPLQILHPRIEPVPDFAPRAEEAGLAEALAAHGRVALWGAPGVGKSLLAQHFAHETRDRYRGVWWVQADQTLREDISALGRRISDEITHIEDADHRFRRSLDLIAQSGAERPWLLVYDNVESPADLAEACPTSGAKILITANHQDWRGRGAEAIEIDVFDVETARTFLLDHAPSETGETAESADNLARALDYSPLALGIAAATCRPIQKSFAEYEAEITASEAVLDAEDSADPRARSVAKAYGFALDRAAKAEPAAEKLMRLICFFAPDAIPVSLIKDGGFEEANGAGSLDKALGALAGLSLIHIRRSEGARLIDLHRLLQRVARARFNSSSYGSDKGHGENKRQLDSLTSPSIAALLLDLIDAVPEPKSDPVFIIGDDNIVHVAEPPDSQETPDNDEILEILRETVDDISTELKGTNSHTDLLIAIQRYRSALNADPFSVQRIFCYGVRVSNAISAVDEKITSEEVAPLSALAEEATRSFIELHAIYVMRHDEGQRLARASQEFNRKPQDIAAMSDAAEAIESSIKDSPNLFAPEVRERISSEVPDIGQGPQPERSNQIAATTLGHLAMSLLRWIRDQGAGAILSGAIGASAVGAAAASGSAAMIDAVAAFLFANSSAFHVLLGALGTDLGWAVKLARVFELMSRIKYYDDNKAAL